MSFTSLNLNPTLLKTLTKHGYKQPTPIQQQAIPQILAGKDLIATAQTGTGKTAAFVLPALQLLTSTPKQTLPQILILAPVRELAAQITTAIHKYSGENPIKVVSILGGMPYHAQMRQLSQRVDILVATPGRLIDYLQRGKINLSQIKMLVLDEADRMLDMGFIDDVKFISKYLPAKRQTLLFTATMDDRIKKLAQSLLHKPEQITIAAKTTTVEKIKQSVYVSDDLQHKNQLLQHFLTAENIYKAIIFSATKRHAEKLSDQLRYHGHAADVLHGDIKQHKRNFILEKFRRGKINLLVATDVAARGIDISDISHVFNYDIPRTGEDYVHRIGRTGRAGKEGIAISLVGADEAIQLKRIERYTGEKLFLVTIPGLEPKRSLNFSEKKSRPQRRHYRNHQHASKFEKGKRHFSHPKKSNKHKDKA